LSEFRHNHYVPRWYQERFLPADRAQREIYYLHKVPRIVRNGRGRWITIPNVELRALKNCFAQRDLYTMAFREVESTELERLFFGKLDVSGRKAVEFWATFEQPTANSQKTLTMNPDVVLPTTLTYLSTQKLRTPKGLNWLAAQIDSRDPTLTLTAVVRYQQVFGAIWAEGIWQIADASGSDTKFIISDHPVTLYNRECSPTHRRCRDAGDPEVHLNGTHTIFPLSLNKVLILTHRSWATNPYGSPMKSRPNPRYERSALFNLTDVQVGRQLSEEEVRRINFIIKSRAYRFVAAAEREWLFPEYHLAKNQKWSRVGSGYLLFPDPRELHHGGEITIEYADGRTMSRDAYGRTPLDPEYGRDTGPPAGKDPLARFKGEFASLFGPRRRGRGWDEPEQDSEALHEHHLSQIAPSKRRVAQPNGGPTQTRRKPKKR
jgi:Protein of unknown function (DUF4238)